MDSVRQKALNELKSRFSEISSEYAPYSFVNLGLPLDTAELKRELLHKKKIGFSTVIPKAVSTSLLPDKKELLSLYEEFLRLCSSLGMKALLNLDTGFEDIILDETSEYDSSHYAKILNCYRYRCFECEKLSYNLHSGKLMSIVAYDGYQKIIDLREFVSEQRLVFELPRGNWEILEFVCAPDEESGRIDYLDYRTSLDYISTVSELVLPKYRSVIEGIKYGSVGFVGKNRRMWCENFNSLFEEKYGFDPAPFYPAVYFDIGPQSPHLKAQFFDCRAEIFKNGFIKAVYDFCSERDLLCLGGLIEPKVTSCSQTVGDAMLSNSYAPSALMNRAYLYGINSVKIAAGAAYSSDKPIVSCDLYEDYHTLDANIALKDAMHSLSRGANKLIVTPPPQDEENANTVKKLLFREDYSTAYVKFVSRVQALLRGGRHVADIALLYPIYSLHSDVYFYDYNTSGFEYPNTPQTADYMSVINSISMYSGHDLTILHPETLNEKCHINGEYIYLDNDINKEKFSIIVIPSTKVISVKSLDKIAEFFDRGGKVIATGSLPRFAIESTQAKNYDSKVVELVSHIFGNDASDEDIMRDYCLNTNTNGGMAYTLYHSLTAADGTSMTNSALLDKALDSFNVHFDIRLKSTKRYESTGALNTVFPVFRKLGLSSNLPNGGMINHIHKRHGDIDVYYISNTTDDPLLTTVTLLGEFSVEEWNPHTGKTKKLSSSYHQSSGSTKKATYTELPIDIPAASSVILAATPIK